VAVLEGVLAIALLLRCFRLAGNFEEICPWDSSKYAMG